ncbi:hypothetical protein Droror1_Dr00004230 [Drosera rotundifolia]
MKRQFLLSFWNLQSVSSTVWYRFVAGLNAQLRRGQTFAAIISWLETHGNPTLSAYGVQVDLAGFHRTATGFSHFGLVMRAAEAVSVKVVGESKCRCSKSKQQLRYPYTSKLFLVLF